MSGTGNRFALCVVALTGLLAAGCGGDDKKDPAIIDGDAAVGGQGGEGGQVGGTGGTGGTGGEAGGTGGSAGAGGAPDAGADLGAGGAPECPAATGYGFIAAPAALTEGGAGNHSPRAIWTGTEFGAVWFHASESEPGIGNVHFQRFNTEGQPVGQKQDLGLAGNTRFDLVWNGGGYLVAWKGGRDRAGNGYPGLQIQALSADGTPVDVPTQLATTHEADRIALAFAPLTGGLLLYTMGRNGADGLYAQLLGEGGESAGAPVRLTAEGAPAQYPAVAFGNGTWGAAWADPNGEMPNQLVFKLLNERAQVVREGNLPTATGARGAIHLAYGSGDVFGLAWSQAGEGGALKPKLTLISGEDGGAQVTPDVTGPEGFGVVTDLAWHERNFFGIAWHDTNAGTQRIGVTRIDPLGVTQPPFPIEGGGSVPSGLSVAGTVSNLAVFYTLDPAPLPNGPSPQAQVYLGRLGACR